MKLDLLKPAKSLNKAYFKQSLKIEQIELFKSELQKTFAHIDEKQDEEYHKNIISKLLLEVYCKNKYLVNVNKKQDLVIRNGNKTDDHVAVILEFKKPTEKKDMVSKDNANVKALQELILYYLRETIDKNNHEIKYLIATNIYEWFVFDGVWFEKHIFNNAALKKDYKNWDVTKHGTDHFYKFIAAKHLGLIDEVVPCTYFNFKDAEKILSKNDLNEKEEEIIINLFKILSPEHLLKLPFTNDSNSLNKEFYNELLYIIGLEETKDSTKKIERAPKGKCNEGALIENTITVLKRTKYFGYNVDEETEQKYFDLALELNITWLNRILFLKLLEGQLIKYNNNSAFSFLNKERIKDFDELDELFFEVLAVPNLERENSVAKHFANIPYLNSSLFELTNLEKEHQGINQLKDRLSMPIYESTVFKDDKGKRITGEKSTLQYLFSFLDAYDFASESSAKIQKQNKTVINASVLGLIFEKINGYKDGSYFTPGFITMYMCKETIHKVVVQKFNEVNGWKCKTIESVQEKIDYTDKEERQKANDIVNSIKICDPAVGSGHFLVSALNSLIEVKSYLKILNYRDKSRVKGFKIEIDNDELIITNEETDNLFEYKLNQNGKPITELQDLQEALFHEKQILIENSLFGVDINPKSVMICRLRLWIELLKNSYYTKESKHINLETLPNIDINIKCGDSLISRFALNYDVFENVPNFINKLNDYKFWVKQYKETNDKKLKDQLQTQIEQFKNEFKKRDPRIVSLEKEITKATEEIIIKYKTEKLFGNDLTEKQVKHKNQLEVNLQKLVENKSLLLNDNLFQGSLEWRFEFPEILDIDGKFNGFDAVIGNPPYIGEKDHSDLFKKYKSVDKWNSILTKRTNLYYAFIIICNEILSPEGQCNLIIPNELLTSDYASHIRNKIANSCIVHSIFDFNKLQVFKGVGTNAMLFSFGNDPISQNRIYRKYENNQELIKVDDSKFTEIEFEKEYLKSNKYWQFIKDEITSDNTTTIDYYGLTTQQGVITGCNIANGKLYNKVIKHCPELKQTNGLGIFVLEEGESIKHLNNEVFINNSLDNLNPNWKKLNTKELEIIKPLYSGNKIHKYSIEETNSYLIWLTKDNISSINRSEIENIIEHLENFKIFLINRNSIVDFIDSNTFDTTIGKGILYNGDGDTQATLGKGNYLVLQKYAYGLSFNEPKLMWQSRGEVSFFLSTLPHYAPSSVNYIYFNKNVPKYFNEHFSKIEILAFLSGVLNSTMYQKYYKGNNNTGTKVKALKIFKIDPNNNKQIAIAKTIADKVLQCLNNNTDDSLIVVLYKEINDLVNELYSLKD